MDKDHIFTKKNYDFKLEGISQFSPKIIMHPPLDYSSNISIVENVKGSH